MAESFAQIPLRDAVVDGAKQTISRPWADYLNAIVTRLVAAPKAFSAVRATLQGAAIPLTVLPLPALAAGLYRFTYELRMTRAPTVSGSVNVTVAWIDGTTALSLTSSTLNWTSGVIDLLTGTATVHLDGASVVTYQTTYASIGATALQYALYLTLEQVRLD